MGEIRTWKTALFLSIIIPVSFFTAFRLTGMLHGPATISETIAMEAVTWNLTRPTMITDINKTVVNSYAGDAVRVMLSVQSVTYYENDPGYPAYSNDYVKVRVRGYANASEGFIYSMKIEFSETEVDANLRIYGDFRAIELTGCRERTVQLFGDSSRKAYFEAYGIDRPKNCSLGVFVAWIFLDDNMADHDITATLEIIYFNGTVYKQINVPITSEVIRA